MKPVQTDESAVYKARCYECRRWYNFVDGIDGVEKDSFIIGYDGKMKERPVSFCSMECKEKFERR